MNQVAEVPTTPTTFTPTVVNGLMSLYDGRMVDLETGDVLSGKMEKVPTNRAIQYREAARTRKLLELPSLPQQTHPIAVILFYRSVGISDDEICDAMRIDRTRLDAITNTDEYVELRTLLLTSISEGDLQDVQSLINRTALDAANRLHELVNHDDLRVVAPMVKDVLDRAGFKPIEKTQVNHKVSGGLNIRYITNDPIKDAIDVSFTEVPSD